MAAFRLLAVDEFLAGHHLEAPAAGGYQLQAGNGWRVELEQLVRQTDGAWGVVSHHAVFDREIVFLHTAPPFAR